MIIFFRKWILRIIFVICRPLPVTDRVVIASSHTRHLSGNLTLICKEIARRNCGAQIVVLTRPAGRGLVGKAGVLWEAMRAEYFLATSRVFIVDDYFFPLYVVKPKPETTVIQTWHASGAFKRVGYSVLDKTFGASEALVRSVHIHSNYDHILMGSKNAIAAYSEAFRQPAEKFVTDIGIPRTDMFFDDRRIASATKTVRAKYHLPADKKVILYAPTFRGATKHEAAYHDDLNLEVMRRRCADDYVILLRLHPFVAGTVALDPSLDGFVFNVSRHSDIGELMLVSDLLVTDYSSAIFEYSLLERPMLFFAPDYEAYQGERGFYFDYASGVPGPVFTSSEQLADYLAAGEFDIDGVREFRAASFDVADGHATQRFVDRLVIPALSTACKPNGADAAGSGGR